MTWGQLLFQDAASPIILQLISFNDHILIILTIVVTVARYAIYSLIINKYSHRYLIKAQQIETIWTILLTILLTIILLFLAIPSIHLLYLTGEVNQPRITLKAIGPNEYWRYKDIEFDSHIIPQSDLSIGDYRLLEVNNHIVPPIPKILTLVIITDGILVWIIPASDVKIDAIPNHLNQLVFTINKPDQWSKIYDANHSFIVISLESVNLKSFCKSIEAYNLIPSQPSHLVECKPLLDIQLITVCALHAGYVSWLFPELRELIVIIITILIRSILP